MLAVPAFIARMVSTFASSISSGERGQTSALAVHPDERKASCLSTDSPARPQPGVEFVQPGLSGRNASSFGMVLTAS